MKDKQACRHHNGEAVKHSRGASHCVITVRQTDKMNEENLPRGCTHAS